METRADVTAPDMTVPGTTLPAVMMSDVMMSDVTAPAMDAVPAIEAVVQAGAVETHYRRAGCGAPVLLLFPGGAADPLAALLFDRLARRFRVIAPLPPACVGAGASAGGEATPVSRWLRDLIDGLGMSRPALVADESLGVAALGFSLMDPGRAGALVAVSRDPADPADRLDPSGPAVVLGGSPDSADHALLVLRLDGAPERSAGAVEEMVRFLEAEAALP